MDQRQITRKNLRIKMKKIILQYVGCLESIILSKITQSEKDKYHMISLICGS